MTTPEPSGLVLFLPLIIVSAIALIPLQQIIHRTGYSRWWCLLLFVPIVNAVGFWVLAYIRWPAIDRSVQKGAVGIGPGSATQ